MKLDSLWASIEDHAKGTDRPFYFYDRSAIKTNWVNLLEALPKDTAIYYSLKANSHPEILKTLVGLGACADIASEGELRAALQAGFQPQQIEFTGPGKTHSELRAACEIGIGTIVVESIQELVALNEVGRELGREIDVSIRIHPKSYVSASGRTALNEPSQFGIDETQLPRLAQEALKLRHIQIRGSHCHVQSHLLSAEHIAKNFRVAASAGLALQENIGRELGHINLGGGIGIPYAEGQEAVDVKALQTHFVALQTDDKMRPLLNAQLRVELGRYLVGTAGIFVTKVLYTKESFGSRFAVVNGGFTQCQIACGAGQVVRRNFLISLNPARDASTPAVQNTLQPTTITGPSCYSQDILAAGVALPPLKAGDLICIHNVGAYGYSFSPIHFLRQAPADEFFV